MTRLEHVDVSSPSVVPGLVSVILVNYRGAEDTIACLKAFDDVDWPSDRLELIVVENASGDDSATRIREAVPTAKVVESSTNSGFAGGCNLGVAHASGEFVGFINNDARPDRDWISAAIKTLSGDSSIGAIACKVLDWDGERIDFADASLTWFGMGYKREVERPDSPAYDNPKDVLFGTGAAMFMQTDLFREVGGFDERFFMFFEDVDLGWRLNLLGYRVRYEPRSIAFHRHHVTMNKFGNFREAYLLERNALLSMYKNYEDASLAVTFAPALALAVRRGLARGDVDATSLDLQRSPGGDDVKELTVSKMGMTGAYAVDYFVDNLETLTADRAQLQRDRKRSDAELFPLFRQAMEPAYPIDSYLKAHQELVDAFGIERLFSGRRRVLIVTGEPLGAKMAGPAIRAFEMAKVLSVEHNVKLASTTGCKLTAEGFETSYVGAGEMKDLEKWADIIVFQGFLLQQYPWLMESTKIIIPDVYDPIHLEQLEQAKDQGEEGRALSVRECTKALNEQLERGDFLMCASDKQRDFWLGQMAALGRLNPRVYDQDESLESLLAVVPFGISDTPPVQNAHGIKGKVPGISATDKVILWGGGVYNWFDPLTLIKAVAVLSERHDDLRLFFLGLAHPNPLVPKMKMATRTRDLSDALGLSGSVVFFNDGWVPYESRADFLLDADLGVSTHLDHVETAFSFRTRILDYLWAGLPIVATGGDTFGSLIEANELGRTVPAGDVDALVEALETMLYNDEEIAKARANVEAFAIRYQWSKVLEPLVKFCRTPRRAADIAHGTPTLAREGELETFSAKRPRPSFKEDMRLLKGYMQVGGVREVTKRATGRVKNTIKRP